MTRLREIGLDFAFFSSAKEDTNNTHSFTLTANSTLFCLNGCSYNSILYTIDTLQSLKALISTQSAVNQTSEVDLTQLTNYQPNPNLQTRITDQSLSATPSPSTDLPLIRNPSSFWHLALSYASTTTLKKIYLIKTTYDSSKCEACIYAKAHKLLFQTVSNSHKAKAPLERIHSDLSGPWSTSKGNSIYSLTLLDEYINYM